MCPPDHGRQHLDRVVAIDGFPDRSAIENHSGVGAEYDIVEPQEDRGRLLLTHPEYVFGGRLLGPWRLVDVGRYDIEVEPGGPKEERPSGRGRSEDHVDMAIIRTA